MNTRRFAIALPNGRESESSAQAFGLVSRITVRRVGGGSGGEGCQNLRRPLG